MSIPARLNFISLICAVSLVASCPSWADDHVNRFLEMPNDVETLTFDLSTLQMIQPGRFSVVSTTIVRPDVMKLELKALDMLRTYCARRDGKYPVPPDVFTLGPPDLPVGNVEVNSTETSKVILWSFPYKRLAWKFKTGLLQRPSSFQCKQLSKSADQLYRDQRAAIMNGHRSKELFDCKRGLNGSFFDEDDDPAKVITDFVSRGSLGERQYVAVCYRVMQEWPYMPE